MAGRFVDFYSEYTPLRKNGGDWRGACPIHGGDNPLNFSVKPDTGEWFCHSQCDCGGDVFAFVESVKQIGFSEAVDFVGQWAGTHAQVVAPKSSDPGRIVATYDYVDASGTLVYQVLRIEPGPQGERKTFRQRRPDGNGGWISNLQGVSRVLYRLPEVLAAIKAGKPIAVVEGEKCADALWDMGVPATTNAMGSGKWEEAYTQALSGADVWIFGDNDAPGQKHAQLVAQALHGRVRSVRMPLLPGLRPKGDVYDWIESGGTRAQLMEIVEGTAEWVPVAVEKPAYTVVQEPYGVEWEPIIPFDTIEPEPFPVDALPHVIREYVKDVSDQLSAPVDFCGMLALATCMAAVRGRVRVVMDDGDYAEPLIMYWVGVAPPGSMKSAIFKSFTYPIVDYEARQRREADRENKSNESRIIADTIELKRIKGKLEKCDDPIGRDKLKQELTTHLQKQCTHRAAPQIKGDDVTPESLASVLAQQEDQSLVVMSEESDFFDNIAGRYSRGLPNVSLINKAYDAQSATVNRKGDDAKDAKGALFLTRPALNLIQVCTPVVIEELSQKKAFRGKGTLGRIAWSFSTFPVIDKMPRTRFDQQKKHRFTTLVDDLLGIPVPFSEDEPHAYHELHLKGDAYAVLEEAFTAIRQRTWEGEVLAPYADWANKLHGRAVRLAGLLHLIEHMNYASETGFDTPLEVACKAPISARTMTLAWAIAEYLIPQALRMFGEMSVDPVQRTAERIQGWIARNVKSDDLTFSTRALEKARFKKGEYEPAIRVLVEHNYIRTVGKPGKSTHMMYEPNPEWYATLPKTA
jgi:hypothetical protein